MKRRDLAWPLPEAKEQKTTSLILLAMKKQEQMIRISLVELEGHYSYAESIGFIQLKHKEFCNWVVSVSVAKLDPETKNAFYVMLKTKYPTLVFSRVMADAFARDDKTLLTRMFRDICEVYDYRTLAGTGWYLDASVTCTRSLGPADFEQLRYELGQRLNHQRNWTLVFWNLALDGDFPIVEAISQYWPNVTNIVLTDNNPGLRFVSSKTTNIEGGKNYCVGKMVDIPGMRERKVEAGQKYGMFVSNSDFEWNAKRHIWVDVFASFGLQIKGTDFGIFE